jgi:hypothetical protein
MDDNDVMIVSLQLRMTDCDCSNKVEIIEIMTLKVPHYIYPVCRTAFFPSNDVSHETKKLVNSQQEKIQQLLFKQNKPQLQ